MQFNINQVMCFQYQSALHGAITFSSPFYCKNCRTFLFSNISSQTSLHKHIIPPLSGEPVPGSQKLADILKFVYNLNVEFWEIANVLFLKSLEYKCPFTVSY